VNTLSNRDVLLIALATLVVLWSIGLSVYTVVSDRRQKKASLDALTASFGEQLRRLARSS
jgi:hypothetical protein